MPIATNLPKLGAATLLALLSLAAPAQDVTCPAPAPLPPPAGELCGTAAGSNGATLLAGRVLAPDGVLRNGQVLIRATGDIACVACDCSAEPEFAQAARIQCLEGVVSPGLIDANHALTFGQNAPAMQTAERYEHRHDWRLGQRGHTQIQTPGGASVNQVRWAEVRQLIAGVTSMNGNGSAPGIVRNVDSGPNGVPGQSPIDNTRFPLDDSGGTQLDSGCGYPALQTPGPGEIDQFTIAEGVDAVARNELLCLSGRQAGAVDALGEQPVHGLLALLADDVELLAERGTTMVWSPRHATRLYGHPGPIGSLVRRGVPLALGTFWNITGSMNLQRELACAADIAETRFPGLLDDRDLWRMATQNAARAFRLDDAIGALAPGLLADIVVFDRRGLDEHTAVVRARPQDVHLVLRGGARRYGAASLVSGCDALDVCGSARAICLLDEIGITFAQLQMSGSGNYPAFFCGTPQNEPTCVPARVAPVAGSTTYDGSITASDDDGDGIPDIADNCPAAFNPVRPLDAGLQADYDGDGIGDECDGCATETGNGPCVTLIFRDGFEAP